MKRKWPEGTWMKLKSKEVLKALKQSRNLSYFEIAEACDCHRSMISQLANGQRTSCGPDLARRISVVLGVPLEVLFDERTSAVGVQNAKIRRQIKKNAEAA